MHQKILYCLVIIFSLGLITLGAGCGAKDSTQRPIVERPATVYSVELPSKRSIRLSVQAGDLTKAKVEATVNAANASLVNGGGVTGAIYQAAGVRQLSKIVEDFFHTHLADFPNGEIDIGQAVITASGNMKADAGIDYIIHVLGPDCRKPDQKAEKLSGGVENILRVATENKVKSVAIPPVSGGIFACQNVHQLIVDSAIDYLKKNNTTLEEVVFIDLGDASSLGIQSFILAMNAKLNITK